MKLRAAMRQIAREMARDLTPLLQRAARRGTTLDMVRIKSAFDAFREARADAPNDYSHACAIVRICSQDGPMNAAQRRMMLDMLGFTGASAYEVLEFEPRDLAVLAEQSPAGVLAHLALRVGVHDGNERPASYIDTADGKRVHAALKRRIERDVRNRAKPTTTVRFSVTSDRPKQPKRPKLQLVR